MMYHQKFVTSVKSNGKILKEIDGQVILPFQSEYSILLKNLESRKALVTVSIDGTDVLCGNSLIVNPNTSLELERFVDAMDKGNKFKFIKKTQEISDYRGDKVDDGLVRVEFRFEKFKTELLPIQPFPYYWNWPRQIPLVKPYIPYPIIYGTSMGGSISPECTTNVTTMNTVQCSTTMAGAISNSNSSAKIEDGITVGGSYSNQQFSYGNIGDLEENSHVIVIGIKGSDKIDKPIVAKTKIKCSTCGKYSKGKFCYSCGTSLINY